MDQRSNFIWVFVLEQHLRKGAGGDVDGRLGGAGKNVDEDATRCDDAFQFFVGQLPAADALVTVAVNAQRLECFIADPAAGPVSCWPAGSQRG